MGASSMVKLLAVIFFSCFMQTSYGQKKVYNNPVSQSLESGEMPLYSDSILSYFQERNESAAIVYHLLIDTSGYVRECKKFPLYGLGNDLDSSSKIWTSIEKEINQKVYKWKFKPNLWTLSDKKLQNTLNNTAQTRPNGGYQTYLVIFHVNDDLEHRLLYIDVLNSLQ
jgi:hypothetical protein